MPLDTHDLLRRFLPHERLIEFRTEGGVRRMETTFTAVYRRVPEGYAAFVEELPGANGQGATLDEARKNLRKAVALVLEANRLRAPSRRQQPLGLCEPREEQDLHTPSTPGDQ